MKIILLFLTALIILSGFAYAGDDKEELEKLCSIIMSDKDIIDLFSIRRPDPDFKQNHCLTIDRNGPAMWGRLRSAAIDLDLDSGAGRSYSYGSFCYATFELFGKLSAREARELILLLSGPAYRQEENLEYEAYSGLHAVMLAKTFVDSGGAEPLHLLKLELENHKYKGVRKKYKMERYINFYKALFAGDADKAFAILNASHFDNAIKGVCR